MIQWVKITEVFAYGDHKEYKALYLSDESKLNDTIKDLKDNICAEYAYSDKFRRVNIKKVKEMFVPKVNILSEIKDIDFEIELCKSRLISLPETRKKLIKQLKISKK